MPQPTLETADMFTAWADPVLGAEEARRLLALPGHVLLQGKIGGHLLGVALAGSMADVLTVFVPGPLRRQGVGRQLMMDFLAHAQQAGALGVTLEVRADNAPAKALYAALGFVAQATRPRYYPDGTDALVLVRLFG